jgi:signal transduction histidine kinase/DNA-binding response OmpR family regulator/ligand-binding sensor domain-containing protein
MWFGTKDGLCRFDGYTVKVFRSSAWTPGKLTHNEIRCIAEDNDHQIWVGTLEGVNIIDKKNFTIKPLDLKYTKKERINTIFVDSRNYVWIGTSNYGILVVDSKTRQFERFSTDNDSPLKLKGNDITNIYEDNSGKVWVSLWKNGLCYIDQNRKKIFYAPKIGSSNNPFRFYQDKDGLYWICTWGDGIFNMTVKQPGIMTIQPLSLKMSDKNVDPIVYSITQDDKFGYIWIVTFSGLRLIEKAHDGSFRLLEANSFIDEDASKMFHEITKDRTGNLWLGSVGEGLYKLDFNKQAIRNFSLNKIKSSMGTTPFVTHICELNAGEILITINRVGLFCYNPKTGDIRRPENAVLRGIQSINALTYISHKHEIWLANEGEETIHIFKDNGNDLDQTNSFSLKGASSTGENNISVLFEDSKGNVWIGSHNGLYLKPENSATFLVSSNTKYVNTIAEDIYGKIWIGTEKEGAFVCNTQNAKDRQVYTLSHIDLKIKNYQSYSVQSILCRNNGDVYIGTREGCLYLYNQKMGSAIDLSGLYGITEEGILNILEDNYGLLWISTLKRIVRYNPVTHTSIYYSNADGMLTNSFFKDACIKLKSGQILFGGNKGMSAFAPSAQNSTLKPQKQNVVISDIFIQNKSIFDDEKNSHFNSKKNRITLLYSESNIGIEFSALDQSSTNKIQYAFKLSNTDKDWTYVGNNRRFVNYTNLPSGNYKFNVKASDENGLWGDQITTLEIEILPPPYKTWWAYLAYFSIIFGLSLFMVKMITNRVLLKNKLEISQIEKVKSEELAQIKLRYFTNISHELLTPLTVIMLLIESLQKKNREDISTLEIMRTNVVRLKRLIQQILVFRKSESGNLKVKIYHNDIIAFVKNICQSGFQPLITEKKINFSIDSEVDSFLAYFDPDKLDKVLYNLLSNAFKYTPRGGSISVKISFVNRSAGIVMRLSVADSGDGIAEEDLPHIFKRFYTGISSDPSQSHGIGLALTNELLQVHKGSIEVKSQLGEGSVFTIEIPVSKEAYSEEEFLEDEETLQENLPENEDIIPSDNPVNIEEELENSNKDFAILVVEDNTELRKLIAENFARKYEVLSAENGHQALEILRDHKIDLVISDITMPEMDGLTLCKKLKNDMTTSHIHVLMLTARNSTNDRIECYNAGADAYIAKPFELRVLIARVNNLIRTRKLKMESFQSNQEVNISSMEYGSIDEDFLKQAVEKVEARLADVSFDFDQFAIDMGSSKSTLHRKLKALTGLAPGEFIRNIRLKHASKMILNNVGNISEIAYAAGFNDPKYFARCFKSEFGLTPTEYQESKK